ncbi:MAG: FAD-binding protein [Coriobacteriales bacterium]|jgi:fumarate reductase flavoprotein subunit|nr:FAD-binding protein [Coriobacteriales bacterium]
MKGIEKNNRGITGTPDMDRRAFLKGALASGALSAVAVATGCSPSTTEAPSTGTTTGGNAPAETAAPSIIDIYGEPTQTLQADLCVVGAGGGCGMAASIEAAEAGLTVVGLEKESVTNGAIAFSEGMTAIGSHFQIEKGVTLTVEEAINKALEYHHQIPRYDQYENWLKRTADTIDWLEAHGVGFEEVVPLGVSLDCWHLYSGDRKKGAGFQMMQDFAAAQTAAGVNLLLDTAGKELIMEDGKVAGCLALTKDNEVIKIEAPAVLLASGGWSNNPDMVRELGGVDPEKTIASGSTSRTGDGILMARAVDAAYAKCPGTIMFYGPILWGSSWGSELQCASSSQPVLWVNQDGERFTNEELSCANFTHAGNAMANEDRVFTIHTKEDLDYWQEVGPFLSLGVHTPPYVPMPDVWKELNESIERGNEAIFTADTIEELAKMIGASPTTFKATVDAYNVCCDNGKDTMFNKNPEYLRPCKTGPFYAFEVANGYFTTVGGLKVNEDTEVINESGEVIPGLYAGGCDAGGLFGDTYDVGILAGSQASWAVNSGRIAADAAIRYLSR